MDPEIERIFSDWHQARSLETGNWGFDMEEATREAFMTGFTVAYPIMKEMLFDVAKFMSIRLIQNKNDETKFIAIADVKGETKGVCGDSPATAIYTLIKAIINKEKFTKTEDLNKDERGYLGLPEVL